MAVLENEFGSVCRGGQATMLRGIWTHDALSPRDRGRRKLMHVPHNIRAPGAGRITTFRQIRFFTRRRTKGFAKKIIVRRREEEARSGLLASTCASVDEGGWRAVDLRPNEEQTMTECTRHELATLQCVAENGENEAVNGYWRCAGQESGGGEQRKRSSTSRQAIKNHLLCLIAPKGFVNGLELW